MTERQLAEMIRRKYGDDERFRFEIKERTMLKVSTSICVVCEYKLTDDEEGVCNYCKTCAIADIENKEILGEKAGDGGLR